MATDAFIQIAETGIGGNTALLHEPQPVFTKIKKCRLKKSDKKGLNLTPKMSNAEEMRKELACLREKYAPFLENHAPVMPSFKEKLILKDFIFDRKEEITLPYFGGPMGASTHTYECNFSIDAIPTNKEFYLCFKGADYITEVVLNGKFCGSHEGFFSPFEFNITPLLKLGDNNLFITLKSDFPFDGWPDEERVRFEGDKLYAATGLGWDNPKTGWHHCPPGSGIYNDVYLEMRSKTHIKDIFVRPLVNEKQAEVWVEIENTEYKIKDVSFLISLYGQNFEKTFFEKKLFVPEATCFVGMGDSLTQADKQDILGKPIPAPAEKGTNIYKFRIDIDDLKLWEPASPYLYQVQVELLYNDEVTDNACRQFGMREFIQDTESEMKGMFYLNGKKIRLRGANTMGYEQLDVMYKDFDQLIDDMLLTKVCNMNFLRITQRPVQEEIYEYCDKLGIMIQTDLPLFGCMRRTKVAEGIRQAEEMEKLIRSHPCCVIISYINEPLPNAKNEPHRHLTRSELENFFTSCDLIVHLNNPDRVIKHVDGDYDPPTEGMPDNHCYPMWYNGHGIDIGKLNKGYWMAVKPDWYYGCGEYGSEGLECSDVMDKYYPDEYLIAPFHPKNIFYSQTSNMYRFFYDTQNTREEWIEKSQEFQAFATKIMTDAFRRDRRMISSAIHHFIDAWPSGWMKTIMDCDRNPKKAFFAYRNSLEPVMVNLRTDRFTYYMGETVSVEAFICNDTNIETNNCKMHFELHSKNGLIMEKTCKAEIKNCDVTAVADVCFKAPRTINRDKFVLKAILLDEGENIISHNEITIEVFKKFKDIKNSNVVFYTDLEAGEHIIAGETVTVKNCGMQPLHFVSRKTGHEIVKEFKEKDFSYWYNKNVDMITPILYKTFTADGFEPVLISGNKNENDEWTDALACGVKFYEGKLHVINLIDLRQENPVAQRFLNNIYKYAK